MPRVASGKTRRMVAERAGRPVRLRLVLDESSSRRRSNKTGYMPGRGASRPSRRLPRRWQRLGFTWRMASRAPHVLSRSIVTERRVATLVADHENPNNCIDRAVDDGVRKAAEWIDAALACVGVPISGNSSRIFTARSDSVRNLPAKARNGLGP